MTTEVAPTMSLKAYKREILALWLELGDLMRAVGHASRGDQRPDDHQIARWGIDQSEMSSLLYDLAKDCRRHRRAPGAPSGSDWRCSVDEDGHLMILRFVARAKPGPWAPSADWTRWGAYGDAIGAVLGARRSPEWIARVEKIDAEPRYAGQSR